MDGRIVSAVREASLASQAGGTNPCNGHPSVLKRSIPCASRAAAASTGNAANSPSARVSSRRST
jgi:hypothetical protein